MTHGSLFSGIGGIDLGFEWAGIETKWQVEIDDYCQKLLSLRFPHTKKFTDVRKVGSHNLEKVDIISGGFPCQDISVAGKGAGLEGERSGLWTELHRVISELRPRFAFIENVPMLTIRGGTRVIADLAEIGYDCEWQVIGADDVGAWHRRKRIWIVAYLPDTNGTRRVRWANDETDRCSRYINRKSSKILSTNRKGYTDVPDTDSNRTKWNESENGKGRRFEQSGEDDTQRHSLNSDTNRVRSHKKKVNINRETEFCDKQDSISGSVGGEVPRPGNNRQSERDNVPDPGSLRRDSGRSEQPLQGTGTYGQTQSRKDAPDSLGKRGCSGDTAGKDAEDVRQLRGSPPYGYWDTEPNVGRVANGIPNRVDRLKGLGNAIVPQVAQIIMERIKESGGK